MSSATSPDNKPNFDLSFRDFTQTGIVGLLLVFLITLIDSIFSNFEPQTSGWGIIEFLSYFVKSFTLYLIVIAIIAMIFFLIFLILGFVFKKGIFKREILQKSISFSFVFLVIILISYPVNYYLLPYLLHIKSIIVNLLFLISIIPLSILFYSLIFKWSGLSWIDNKYFSIIIIILSIAIIIVPLVIPEGDAEIEFLKDVEDTIIDKPNIMIITIDTLRRDHLSCYGYNKIDTKNIDGIAEDGFIFTSASPGVSWTTPSMMSMLTAKYPTVHGCIDVRHSCPEPIISITQVLNHYGYQTYGIVTTCMLNDKFGFARGFDTYLEYGDIVWLKYFDRTRVYTIIKMIQQTLLEMVGISENTTQWATNRTLEYFDDIYKEPFFLWIHYLDPHSPYTPPDEYIENIYQSREKSLEFKMMEYLNRNEYIKENENPILNLYDAEIMFVDDMIGDITGEMKSEGIYEDTVVVISADHGEEFWEHKRWGHGYTLYNEVMKIPLILKPSKGYDIDFDDRNIDTPVSLMYIPETIMDFLNLKGQYKNFGNHSLLDFTIIGSDDGSTEQHNVYSETLRAYPHLKKIRTPEYSLIYDEDTEEIELYELIKDPGELMDISEKNPGVVKRLMKELLYWMDEVKKEREVYGKAEDIGLDMMTREEMRGLGYID